MPAPTTTTSASSSTAGRLRGRRNLVPPRAPLQRRNHLGGQAFHLCGSVMKWGEQDQFGAGVDDLAHAVDTRLRTTEDRDCGEVGTEVVVDLRQLVGHDLPGALHV